MAKDPYISGFKWLAVYQIAGGLLGIVLMGNLFFAADFTPILYVMIICVGLLLYIFSIYCGIILFQSKSNSLVLSFVCQSLQAISVSFFGFYYKYVSGFLFSIILESTDSFHLRFGLNLSSFSFVIGGDSDGRTIEFNTIAIGIMVVLAHAIKSIAIERRGDMIDSIGS